MSFRKNIGLGLITHFEKCKEPVFERSDVLRHYWAPARSTQWEGSFQAMSVRLSVCLSVNNIEV